MHLNNPSWLVERTTRRCTRWSTRSCGLPVCAELGYDRRDITPAGDGAAHPPGKEVGGYRYDSRETNGIEVYVQSDCVPFGTRRGTTARCSAWTTPCRTTRPTWRR
jgi:hypothetical protein